MFSSTNSGKLIDKTLDENPANMYVYDVEDAQLRTDNSLIKPQNIKNPFKLTRKQARHKTPLKFQCSCYNTDHLT